MSWFSNLTRSLFPESAEQKEAAQAKELSAAVALDKKALPGAGPAVNISKEESTLSPLGSHILEKAKEEALRDDDDTAEDRRRIVPAQLFMTNKEAEKRVEHIQSVVLEKSKTAQNKFVKAAKAIPSIKLNAFAKRKDINEE